MDHVLSMAAAVLSGIGWALATRRETVLWWVKVLAWPAMGWLVWYFVVELSRSQPELWSGKAQMSRYTIAVIAVGVFLLWQAASLTSQKQDGRERDGGERHA